MNKGSRTLYTSVLLQGKYSNYYIELTNKIRSNKLSIYRKEPRSIFVYNFCIGEIMWVPGI